MSGAIAIFAKTPGLTPVKTRLAAGIGQPAADEFYALCLNAVERSVQDFLAGRADWVGRWAVAEKAGVENPRWAALGARHTGEGDLGRRLWRIYEGLRFVHGRVLLIGTDSPQITPQRLAQAADLLQSTDFVLGPARDGGFWLFGGRRAVPKTVWDAPAYGGGEVTHDLTAAMADVGLAAPQMLDTLTDVDERDDLDRLVQEMPDTPSDAQRTLREWVQSAVNS